MSAGRVSFRVAIIPISKPLPCWLVSDDDPTPFGPHEVHAMAVVTDGVSAEAQEVLSGKQRSYNVPDALYRQAELMLDMGADPESMYFVPTSQSDGDGSCWWPAKYVSFTPEGCEHTHKRLKGAR